MKSIVFETTPFLVLISESVALVNIDRKKKKGLAILNFSDMYTFYHFINVSFFAVTVNLIPFSNLFSSAIGFIEFANRNFIELSRNKMNK